MKKDVLQVFWVKYTDVIHANSFCLGDSPTFFVQAIERERGRWRDASDLKRNTGLSGIKSEERPERLCGHRYPLEVIFSWHTSPFLFVPLFLLRRNPDLAFYLPFCTILVFPSKEKYPKEWCWYTVEASEPEKKEENGEWWVYVF